MPYDPVSRRQALRKFLDKSDLSMSRLAAEAHLSESSIRHFLAGRAHALADDTWCALADAASDLLRRAITPGQLRGEDPPPLPIWGYAGAGAEVHPFEDQGAFEYISAPPGLSDGACVIVRGDSMLPRYQDGDRLFYRQRELQAEQAAGEECIVQVRDGPIYVKRLERGSRRGRWDLVSINQAVRTIEDQPVAWAARIEWIQRAPLAAAPNGAET